MIHEIKFTDDVLKVQIGVKFTVDISNGDYNEYARIYHTESPIYLNKAFAKAAFSMFLQKIITDKKEKIEKYIKYQTKYEKKRGTNVQKWIESTRKRGVELAQEEADRMEQNVVYEPVFIYTDSTSESYYCEYAD